MGQGPGNREKDCMLCSGQLKFQTRMGPRHTHVGCFPAGEGSLSRGLAFSRNEIFLGETLHKGTRFEGAQDSSLRGKRRKEARESTIRGENGVLY